VLRTGRRRVLRCSVCRRVRCPSPALAITLDRYSHVMPTMQAEAVRRLDGVLSGKLRVQMRVRRIPRPRKSPDSRSESGPEGEFGTAYRIRTGDLRLERAVS
jgi:hypothetical protein